MSDRCVIRAALASIAVCTLAIPLAAVAVPLADPAPNTWQQVARFGGTPVRGLQVFTIGDAAYVVSGMPDASIPHHEVWRYSATDNTWTRIHDYPGTPIIEGAGFSLAGKGYICCGNVSVTPDRVREFWQYDPASDELKRKADFPGTARSGFVAATIDAKA